jgi:UDP-N-acetylmuramate dehydrogenase
MSFLTVNEMNIQQNVPLNDKNWFKTGGLARFFCEPKTPQEFSQAVIFAHENAHEIFVLGEGANILISDDGFNGLVIRPRIISIIKDSATFRVTAGAGVSIQALIDWCLDNHLSGLEEFSGIPGSIGGAVYINIHYYQFLLSQFLVSATVVDRSTGVLETVDVDWFNFGYNQSKLLEGRHYLVDAMFQLKPVDDYRVAYAQGRRDEIIRHRHVRYPTSNTCGSFFRNFQEHELPFEINGKKVPFVAYYLDKIGVKGALKIGGACVSYQHANMLVTQSGATTRDVIELARTMQQRVHEQFGIVPQAECQIVGFKENPLL